MCYYKTKCINRSNKSEREVYTLGYIRSFLSTDFTDLLTRPNKTV